jgi:hypothetical protein
MSSYVKTELSMLMRSSAENFVLSILNSSSSTTTSVFVGMFALVNDYMNTFINQVRLYLYIGLTFRRFLREK